MTRYFAFLIAIVLAFRADSGFSMDRVASAILTVRTNIACRRVMEMDLNEINRLIRPIWSKSITIASVAPGCGGISHERFYLDLILAKGLKEQMRVDSTWYVSLFSWHFDLDALMAHMALLNLHLEFTLRVFAATIGDQGGDPKVLEELVAPSRKSDLLRLAGGVWCVNVPDSPGCRRAVSRSAEILDPRGSSLVPAPAEVIRWLENEEVQRQINAVYDKLRLQHNRLALGRTRDFMRDGQSLYEIALSETGGDEERALLIIGFLTNREAKSLISYGQILIALGKYSHSMGEVLKNLSLILPMARLIDQQRIQLGLSQFRDFSFPSELRITSDAENYHFWSSVYMARRLSREGHSVIHSVYGAYAFGKAYGRASALGTTVRHNVSALYWGLVDPYFIPLVSDGLGIQSFADWLREPGNSLLAQLPYPWGIRDWMRREMSQMLHLFGAIWYFRRGESMPAVELSRFIQEYPCVGVGKDFEADPIAYWDRVGRAMLEYGQRQCETGYMYYSSIYSGRPDLTPQYGGFLRLRNGRDMAPSHVFAR